MAQFFQNIRNNKYLSLFFWILIFLLVGSIMGSLTKPEINNWYSSLNKSSLTPPNFVFPVAWTILYISIAVSGWIIWQNKIAREVHAIKTLYLLQIILNWSWTPLFFYYHLTSIAFFVLLLMDISVLLLICISYSRIKLVSFLLLPYLLWILFASYLNYYIWLYN